VDRYDNIRIRFIIERKLHGNLLFYHSYRVFENQLLMNFVNDGNFNYDGGKVSLVKHGKFMQPLNFCKPEKHADKLSDLEPKF